MAYAEYEYYKMEYHGTIIPEEEFERFAAQASREIDLITNGKAEHYDDTKNRVKNAMCAAAEIYYEAAQDKANYRKNAGKTSETVGRYSVTYRDASASASYANTQLTVNQALREYLWPTGLLYRGAALVY